MPVVRGARATMHLFNIYFGDACIMLNHFERAVTQERLESEQVAAVAQVGDGERVSEFVRISFLDGSPFSDIMQKLTQMILFDRPVESVTEEWSLGIFAVLSISKIAPHGIAAGFA